jgi:hypothetical protein
MGAGDGAGGGCGRLTQSCHATKAMIIAVIPRLIPADRHPEKHPAIRAVTESNSRPAGIDGSSTLVTWTTVGFGWG